MYVDYEIFYLLAVDVVALVVAYVAAEIMLEETERARRLRVPSGQNLERGFLPLPGHASDSKSECLHGGFLLFHSIRFPSNPKIQN